MVWDILSTAGKWATILLALEAFLFSLLPLFVLYKFLQFLYRFIPKLVPAMRLAHQKMVRIAGIIERIAALMVAPFVWSSGFLAKVRAYMVSLRRVL